MRLRIALLCMVLVLMASCVSAFPLTGGNGQISASVLGTMTLDDDVLYIDIIGSSHLRQVTLVDSEDKFYNAGTLEQNMIGGSSDRSLYFVKVPTGAEIKRIRITPDQGDPFSIEWTGVPEVGDSLIGMKFYGLQTKSEERLIKSWTVDVKVTNNGSQKQMIDGTQIEVVDQFGFPYRGTEGSFKQMDLMPGESARVAVRFGAVSALSRPIYLVYLPSNLTMDISAWA